jgi:uncharacterized Zn-binding protein involved in type VI secretion
VLIAGLPAAVVNDQTVCPLVTGTVLIGGRPAARVGDSNVENGPPATIITGALTVLIGP